MTMTSETQTKIHHSSKSYAEANSEAAKEMRDKLHDLIKTARGGGNALLNKVIAQIPTDTLAPMPAGKFISTDEDKLTYLIDGDNAETANTVHPFALAKMCETVGVPKEYVERLKLRAHHDTWAQELLLETMNRHFHNHPRHMSRRLFRRVGGQIRGFLSDSYARLDPGALLGAFAESCQRLGLSPYGGHVTDTQFVIRATLNTVIEPIKDEVLGIGVVFKESPFGDGATELSIQIERMMCTNKAVRESQLKKVHVGGRAPSDLNDAEEQYQRHTKVMVAEINATMEGLFAPAALERISDGVKAAHSAKITPGQFDAFVKKYLNKGEAEEVQEIYRSADITNLPAGDTYWRATQALGFFATKIEDPARAFEVQKLAGTALNTGLRKLT
jgi:hypothetical protein